MHHIDSFEKDRKLRNPADHEPIERLSITGSKTTTNFPNPFRGDRIYNNDGLVTYLAFSIAARWEGGVTIYVYVLSLSLNYS